MSINPQETPFLFSTGSVLAYEIAKSYYGNIHYVWCTTNFNSPKQPVTSNPFSICRRFFEQITTCDRHAVEIKFNKSGILIGAKTKLDSGIITEKVYNEIAQLIEIAKYDAFYPVLYIINTEKVKNKCKEVQKIDKASDTSIEYKIEELMYDEFQIIHFKDLLHGILDIADMKAGD